MFTLSVPVSYHLHHIRNKLTDESGTEHYASVAPAFSLRHQISAKMDMAARFKYSLSPPKADMHLRNVMMNDFRNLTVPEDVSEYKEEHHRLCKYFWYLESPQKHQGIFRIWILKL